MATTPNNPTPASTSPKTDRTTPSGGRTTGTEPHAANAQKSATQNEPQHTGSSSAQNVQGPASDRQQQMPTSRETGRDVGRPGSSLRRQSAGGGLPATYGALGSPFALMQQIQSEMDRIFEDFGFGRGLLSPFGGTGRAGLRGGAPAGGTESLWSPQLDMFRRGEEIVVRADLPGLSKDDVTIEVEDGVLTIRGERKHEAHDDREGFIWNERSYGTFERSIALPEGVNDEQAKASFHDGVLEVSVPAPKTPERRSRRIEIR